MLIVAFINLKDCFVSLGMTAFIISSINLKDWFSKTPICHTRNDTTHKIERFLARFLSITIMCSMGIKRSISLLLYYVGKLFLLPQIIIPSRQSYFCNYFIIRYLRFHRIRNKNGDGKLFSVRKGNNANIVCCPCYAFIIFT